ncbi:MAG: WHG domain-containing protein [Sphaerochaetaceae bacterium]|jgi:hypothetical protein
MEELRSDVMQAAEKLYRRYIEAGMKDPAYPPYKASGISYIKFAKEEKELFKLLFMRDRSQEKIKQDREDISELLHLISANTGMSMDDAYMFHMEMWIFVHGIATMIATSYVNWDKETISRMMTDAYQGIKERYKDKRKE